MQRGQKRRYVSNNNPNNVNKHIPGGGVTGGVTGAATTWKYALSTFPGKSRNPSLALTICTKYLSPAAVPAGTIQLFTSSLTWFSVPLKGTKSWIPSRMTATWVEPPKKPPLPRRRVIVRSLSEGFVSALAWSVEMRVMAPGWPAVQRVAAVGVVNV